MDGLGSLNIVPFLGLMNILEVKYLHMPEVYRTMLAILCDYNPLIKNSVMRTKHYLKMLLAREPDLAQYLFNFMDEPVEKARIAQSSCQVVGSEQHQGNQHLCAHPAFPISAQPRSAEHGQEDDASVRVFGTPSQSLDNTALRDCLVSIQPLTAAIRAVDFSAINLFHTDVATDFSSATGGNHHASALCRNQLTHDRVPHFVPVIDIQHRGVLTAERVITSTSPSTRVQDVPIFSSRLLPSLVIPASLHTSLERTSVLVSPNRMASEVHGELRDAGATHHMLVNSHSFTQLSTKCPEPLNTKIGRKSKIVQSQTSTTDQTAASKLHKMTAGEETTHTPKSDGCSSPSGWDWKVAPTGSLPSSDVASPSNLLGQPSVAYFPVDAFMDNCTSAIFGSKQASTVEQCSFYTSSLSGKLSGAAAKLKLLSTQAGSDKTAGLTHGKLGQAATTVSTKLGTLYVQTPTGHSEETNHTADTQLSPKSAESRQTVRVSFSKTLSVPKPDSCFTDTPTASAKQNEKRRPIISSDKQVQVGQRLISRKSKSSLEKREKASHLFPLMKTCQEPAENLGQCFTASAYQQTPKSSPHTLADERGCVNTDEETSLSQPASQQLGQGALAGQQPAAAQGSSSRKSPQRGSTLVSGNSEACKQKFQVVEVSLGGAHSLSSFPYIQQMVLPDGQMSTIAHNSYGQEAVDQRAHIPVSMPESTEQVKAFISRKLPMLCKSHQGRAQLTQPKTQIILPKNQVKLSVSIQTSSTKLCTTSSRKRSFAEVQPNSEDPIEASALVKHTFLCTTQEGDPRDMEESKGHWVETDSVPDQISDIPDDEVSPEKGKSKRSKCINKKRKKDILDVQRMNNTNT